uniref:Heterogeneous nuclear ribonucleoprotein K (Trinotate prediction) n=1 Tax=Henneguya salminicola TaxID=69463 RepID=A0A6G3MIG8_HENSL
MAFRKNSGLLGLYKMMEEQTLIISDENKVEENIENEQPEVEEVKTADPLINIPPEKEFTNSTVLSSKESQQEKFTHELRFLIMNSYAGALIGRGGERIKALHEKYDVHLSIPMTHTSLRVGILTGKKTPILNSLQEIIPILKKPPIESFEGKDHQINFVVPDTFAPIIIGTGGSRISSLRKV